MKINWNQDPFLTTVELDDADKERLLVAYQMEAYESLLFHLHFSLEKMQQNQDLSNLDHLVKLSSKSAQICDMTVESPEIQSLFAKLDSIHIGDCTCEAASCVRCYVEDLLGINTLKNLDKQAARKIQGAFSNMKTIDEAIATLEQPVDYTKPDRWPDSIGYEIHIPRWEASRLRAVEWLKQYKAEHGF